MISYYELFSYENFQKSKLQYVVVMYSNLSDISNATYIVYYMPFVGKLSHDVSLVPSVNSPVSTIDSE